MSQFPTLYKDGRIRVYTNGSGEIFIEERRERGVTMRISPHNGNHLVVTSQDGLMTPTSLRGLDAFRVQSKSQR